LFSERAASFSESFTEEIAYLLVPVAYPLNLENHPLKGENGPLKRGNHPLRGGKHGRFSPKPQTAQENRKQTL